MEHIARGFEVVGVAIIIVGGAIALVFGFIAAHRDRIAHPSDTKPDISRYFTFPKREFGRPLILGLEILVAADIIQTITVEPSLESVGVLAILVAVRIALSFSLDIEIDGMVPWRKAAAERAAAAERTTTEG